MSIAVELEKLRRQKATGALSPAAFEEAKNRLLEDCVRRIETIHERKFPPGAPKPPASTHWGIPPVRVVRGVVQNVRFSPHEDGEQYVASMDITDIYGQPVEISSSTLISIAAGDRVTLGGYERKGKLCALAYYNESNGTHSDLSRLREGYRTLITAGRASVCTGFAVIIGAAFLPILHRRAGAIHPGLWRLVPYALTALAAAAVSYFGLGLSYLGSLAKEFHDTMSASCDSTE